ncbi:MAG: hypothetical protein LPJ89_01540 [Hymenobacteraceae bacterium]|nr:hypothetical protein [Hymenobacteraceae bacterium]MDX5396747.1 hypothetical protein [Hymenobacteraceae bacterium]MDX5442445.1 hypothetical protein [Hymenobacteraceae bacterium]MDX5512809.1 hypothetical protein [Hymenobacteraceae bacterium]
MKKPLILVAALVAAGLVGCDTTRQQNEADTQVVMEDTVSTTGAAVKVGEVMESGGIKMYSFNDSPQYPEAALRMREPQGFTEPGQVQFTYDITNFQLTKQTSGQHAEHMANSHQGQHIHNIIDNEPYTAHYETSFTKEMQPGNHVVLSFLSRSYHESLKHKSAYDLQVVTAGRNQPASTFDVNAPHMFYSRPKGEYVGEETKKVMLDFYLVNTDLSPTGNQVRATINGNTFMLKQWLPYIMEGLPMGENTIKLELVDSNGNLIPGPFNTVERKITLKAS